MVKIGNITFTCQDPERLANFWAQALHYQLEETPPELLEFIDKSGGDKNAAAAAFDPKGHSPRLFFIRRSGPPVTKEKDFESQCEIHLFNDKTVSSATPIHLDLTVDDLEGEISRFIELGATLIKRKSQTLGPFESHWAIMKDPEGNGFCLQ